MKKVLVFTYYFPPAGGVAVQRFLKFSKYLPEYGWDPVIVTVANGSYPYYDESLLNEVSPSLRVYRTPTFEPFEFYNLLRGKKGKSLPLVAAGADRKKSFFQRLSEYVRANLFVPDARMGWKPYAIKQAEAIIRQEKIDAIITTGPPHSTHLIGLALKQKYGIKWIADFRDPWTQIFSNQFLPRTKATIEKDKALEKSVLENADAVTVISPGMKQIFAAFGEKVNVIYNGYDAEDFSTQTPAQGTEFVIRYVGNLMNAQNVPAFWNALSAIRKKYPFVRLEIIGRADEAVKAAIAFHGLNDLVHYTPFLPHRDAVAQMQNAALLLFVIPDVPENDLILTGKIFEYLASGTNIISFGPPGGDAATILRSTGRAGMLEYGDEQGAVKQLESALGYFAENQVANRYSGSAHEMFSRKSQAGELSHLLLTLSCERSA